MTKKRISSLIVAALSVGLSACVTQDFDSDEMPVVKTQANRDDMAATRVSLGLGYLKMGNMAQAKQNLEKAKKFAPEMVQVYTAFAHYYETVGEHDLTIASFEEALSLKSDDADTLNNYGVYLCRQDQTEVAEKLLLKAIAVPSYILVAKSYENLSSCFLKKDNFEKAEMYLNKAVMHSPGNSSTLFQMVRLQYAMGEYTEAKLYEQRFEKVTRRFTPESLALAYKVYWKLGQRRTAKNYGSMLVKMYPQSWESQQYMLNELELIEADNLAERYQFTELSGTLAKSKKRVVKLSPKSASSSNAASNSRLIESEATTPKIIKSTNIADNQSHQDKRVVVLTSSEPLVNNVEKVPTVENKINSVADKKLIKKTETNEVTLVEKEAVIADKEIVHIAQKPTLIIEDTDKLEEPLAVVTTETRKIDDTNNDRPEIHVVSKGDTLYRISKKYKIKIKALRDWNNLTDNIISINDKLYLIDPKTVNE